MRKIVPIVSLLALTGCVAPVTGAVLAGATAISYSTTGKSPTDYAASRLMHKDCDFRNVRAQRPNDPTYQSDNYCIDPPSPPSQETVYCYRTLGTPDCSTELDPHENRQQPIVGSSGYADLTRAGLLTHNGTLPRPITPISAAPARAPEAAGLSADDDNLSPSTPPTALDSPEIK